MLRRLPRRAVSTVLGPVVALAPAAVVLVGSPAPAAAVLPWEASVPVAASAAAVSLAVDDDGVRHVVLDRRGAVVYRSVSADGTRSPLRRVSAPDRATRDGSVTDLGDGRVLVTWTEVRPRSDSVLLSRVVSGGRLGDRVVVARGPISAIGPRLGRAQVAVVPGAADGARPARVLVTWISENYGSLTYVSARDLDPRSGDAVGARPFALAFDFVMDDDYALAADPASGAISAVYAVDDDDYPTHLMAATLPADETEADEPVEVTGGRAVAPDLAVAADGTLVVGWSDERAEGGAARVATVDPTSGRVLGEAVLSPADGPATRDVDVALDSTDLVTAAWSAGATGGMVRQAQVGAGGALTVLGDAPRRVGVGDAPRLVVDGADQVSVVVQQTVRGDRPVVRRLAADGAPGSPRYLLPFRPRDPVDPGSARRARPTGPTLALAPDGEGRVHALWSSPLFGAELSVSDVPTASAVPAQTYLRRTPSARTSEQAATFIVGSDAVLGRVEYRLDGSDWTAADSRQVRLTGLTPGVHRIEVRVTDRDGTDPDPTPARWRWRILG